jgi:uncharacterized protein YjbJ (UPF0337 family)
MDKHRVQGAGRLAKGSVKKALGKITGDRRLQAKGAAARTAGRVQGTLGKAKDGLRGTFKK